mgnify:CR=1 FL=1
MEQLETLDYEELEPYASVEDVPQDVPDYTSQFNTIIIALGVLAGMMWVRNIWK